MVFKNSLWLFDLVDGADEESLPENETEGHPQEAGEEKRGDDDVGSAQSLLLSHFLSIILITVLGNVLWVSHVVSVVVLFVMITSSDQWHWLSCVDCCPVEEWLNLSVVEVW